MNEDVKNQALAECVNSGLKLTDIAKKHGIPLWKLTYWIRQARVRPRKRGAKPMAQPSVRAKEILDYAATHGFSDAARHFAVSRQLISSLAKRWNVSSTIRLARLQTKVGSPRKRKRKARKLKREVVVSFRLRKEELSSLRELHPSLPPKSRKSAHKLVRSLVLKLLEVRRDPNTYDSIPALGHS
jgi:transposase-like protein